MTVITISSVAIISGTLTNKEKVLVAAKLDNGFFREEHKNFELQADYTVIENAKKHLLVVGNSHGEDF